MAGPSPTLRRRELGALLRELRRNKDLTVDHVASELLCSAAKVSRMETGQRRASLRDVRDLSRLYDVDDATRQRMEVLVRESHQTTWWQSYDLPYGTYIGLEDSARTISEYRSGSVSGLLQTEEYARTLVRDWFQPDRLAPDVVEQRVKARRERQEILTRPDPPRVWDVMDEAVLHHQVGGPAVMLAQIDHLIAATELPNVTLQVVPFSVGAHPGLDSVFTILGFHQPAVPDVVYVEGQVGDTYLERENELDRYRRTFDYLRAVALSPAATLALFHELRASYSDSG